MSEIVGLITDNDGNLYAGNHLLIDFYNCEFDDSLEIFDKALTEAAIATGATILNGYSHPFDGGGSSGVLVLAESHISWHYWFDEKYIAFDVFVCGVANPWKAVNVLKKYFNPTKTDVQLVKRGININK